MLKGNYKLFLVSIILLFTLTGCSSDTPDLKQKAKSEIDYFSVKLINILNKLNNITFENYEVTAKNVELSKDSASNEKPSDSSSKSGSGPAEVKGSESSEGENNIIAFQMSPNTILNPVTTEIDWKSIKNEIENIYYSWNTIILDLYELDVPSEEILGFSSDLDIATKHIKNEDKQNSILAVANLYKYLIKYAEIVSTDDKYSNIIKIKSNILNAYAFLNIGYWDTVAEEINNALETFQILLDDLQYVSQNSYKVNKVYVLLNELNNSLNLKDQDIFYIKYRNLMEELIEI